MLTACGVCASRLVLSGNRRTREARDDVGEGGALRWVWVERDDDEVLDVPGHVRRNHWPPRPVLIVSESVGPSIYECDHLSVFPSFHHGHTSV